MTALDTLKEIIDNDERFELVGEKTINGQDVALYFAPVVPMRNPLDLENLTRNLFCGIPEVSGIVSTHSGVVMMTCSERLDKDARVPPRNICVQGFLSVDAAHRDYGLLSR